MSANSTLILTEVQYDVLVAVSEWVTTSAEGLAFLSSLPEDQRQTYIEVLNRLRAATPQPPCGC